MIRRSWILVCLPAFLIPPAAGLPRGEARKESDARLRPYAQLLQREGQEPVRFVLGKLEAHDLLIFDDALHTAVEPFDFYRQLIKEAGFQRLAPAIFLETIPSNKQRHIDEYLAAAAEDPRLLHPAFQDDASGTGFPYQTYFDLLRAIWTVNRELAEERRLRVLAVGSPTFWSEIHTPRDLEQFRKSLASYDHHMYATIRDEMNQFAAGRKGIFLTNTRHAYKQIRRKDGQLFWNTATFFTQRHPGRSYSIRLHNVSLFVQAAATPAAGTARTTQGLEGIQFSFVRIGDGLWDSAFRENENRPVAFSLEGNVFGEEPYIGNHQLDALPGQRMKDAYDAVIFLAPTETLRQTAFVDSIYSPAFKRELERRYRISHTPQQLAALLEDQGAGDLGEYIDRRHAARLEQPLPQARDAGPIDAWRRQSAE